jgi:hypothetical protein
MSYSGQETSTESGQPIELYEWALGATTYRYTSSELPYTLSGSVYSSEIIDRSQIVNAADDKQDRVEVRMPTSNAFAANWKTNPPGSTATLTLRRVHRTDGANEAKIYFKGIVHGVSFADEGKKAVIMVVPLTSQKAKQVPRYTFQSLCNYSLFDADCKVSEATYSHDLACTAASADTLTLTGAGALGADYFEAGFIEYNSEYRLCIGQSGDVLTILIPFASSPNGQTVKARAGCKKRLSADCNTKFSNAINFGGYQWVPTKNPFETGLD